VERWRGGEERSVGTKKEERSGDGGKQKINTSPSKSQAIGGRGGSTRCKIIKNNKKRKKKKRRVPSWEQGDLPGSRETEILRRVVRLGRSSGSVYSYCCSSKEKRKVKRVSSRRSRTTFLNQGAQVGPPSSFFAPPQPYPTDRVSNP
jgi:hypothetical protein